jgi:adenine-specific DNA methylase
MKYMGSKRRMLRDGLGDLICNQAQYALRIVDLFCGAGSVAWYAAQNTTLPVVAVDLQTYAVVMARAVIARDSSLDPDQLKRKWLSKAKRGRLRSRLFRTALVFQEDNKDIDKLVQGARALCQKEPSKVGPQASSNG